MEVCSTRTPTMWYLHGDQEYIIVRPMSMHTTARVRTKDAIYIYIHIFVYMISICWQCAGKKCAKYPRDTYWARVPERNDGKRLRVCDKRIGTIIMKRMYF